MYLTCLDTYAEHTLHTETIKYQFSALDKRTGSQGISLAKKHHILLKKKIVIKVLAPKQ